jgi:alcohol dehydrogenase (cytochrome c)
MKQHFLLFAVLLPLCVHAQGELPNIAALLPEPPPDSWLTYHGDYSGQRHSPLQQITPDNVHTLGLAWAWTSGSGSLKGVPLMVDGIVYITSVDHMWALDARTGREIWHYASEQHPGFRIGQRGTAIWGDLVYLTTPDARLEAIDRFSGEQRWEIQIADGSRGYWSTNAPLLIRDHLIVGVSGDFDNLPGLLRSYHPATGELQWTFYSTLPSDLRTETTDNAYGGQMWMTGTYDPELNLLYVGTGNPTPVLNSEARPGNNEWTGSIVALNPDTGELAWGFQVAPHDTHDWDAAEVPVLVDAEFNGQQRKLLLQASRNGYYVVLDRVTGENLLSTTFARVNWSLGEDELGRPINDPDKFPRKAGALISPDEAGATNYRSPGFDPATGLLIVSAADAYGIYFYKEEHGDYGWAGADYGVQSTGYLRALQYETGALVWEKPIYSGNGAAGVLTTATGLTFTGDGINNALALESATGKTLWHSGIGRVGNMPVTWMLDGRQHVLLAAGSTLFSFVLPKQP